MPPKSSGSKVANNSLCFTVLILCNCSHSSHLATCLVHQHVLVPGEVLRQQPLVHLPLAWLHHQPLALASLHPRERPELQGVDNGTEALRALVDEYWASATAVALEQWQERRAGLEAEGCLPGGYGLAADVELD